MCDLKKYTAKYDDYDLNNRDCYTDNFYELLNKFINNNYDRFRIQHIKGDKIINKNHLELVPGKRYVTELDTNKIRIFNTDSTICINSPINKEWILNDNNQLYISDIQISAEVISVSSLERLFRTVQYVEFRFDFKQGDEYREISNNDNGRRINFTFATGKRIINYTNNKNETKTRVFDITKNNNIVGITRVNSIGKSIGGSFYINNNNGWSIKRNVNLLI